MTQATQLVLRAMLEMYGAEIRRATGLLPSGTVSPIMARLENAGILTHRVEDVDPVQACRPRRKYYSFTPDGAERARDALARHGQEISRRSTDMYVSANDDLKSTLIAVLMNSGGHIEVSIEEFGDAVLTTKTGDVEILMDRSAAGITISLSRGAKATSEALDR